MPPTLTVTELSRKLTEYINRVLYRGERFVLTRGNKPVAEIRPIRSAPKLSELPAIYASMRHLSREDAEDFAKDIEAARNSELMEDYDPWER